MEKGQNLVIKFGISAFCFLLNVEAERQEQKGASRNRPKFSPKVGISVFRFQKGERGMVEPEKEKSNS